MEQLIAVAKATSSPRDMWLVLLGGALDLPASRLRVLTRGEALQALDARRTALAKHLTRLLRKQPRDPGELMFPSRKGNGPVGRIQVWRILSGAFRKVLGKGSWGIKTLRKLLIKRTRAPKPRHVPTGTRPRRTLSGWHQAQQLRGREPP